MIIIYKGNPINTEEINKDEVINLFVNELYENKSLRDKIKDLQNRLNNQEAELKAGLDKDRIEIKREIYNRIGKELGIDIERETKEKIYEHQRIENSYDPHDWRNGK